MEKEKNNNNFIQNIKLTYKYAKDSKKDLIVFFICQIFRTTISIIVPILIAKRLLALTSTSFNKVLIYIILIFLIEVFRNMVNLTDAIAFNRFYYKVTKNIQIGLTEEILKLKQVELNTNSSGVFIERINNDTNNISDIFAMLVDHFTSLIGNLGVLITIFIINKYIGLAYLIFIIITIIFNNISSKINQKNRKLWKKSREKTGGFVSEIIRGAKDIKILNAEKSFLYKADEYMNETNKVAYNYHITERKLRFLGGTLRDTSDLFISVILYILLVKNILKVEMVIIIMNYHRQVIDSTDWIERVFDMIKQYNLSANRIFGILDGNEFEKESFGKNNIKKIKGNIEFKDVFFSYEDKREVLKGLNFNIKANQTVGFAGPSGSGKSTIFNLISALNKTNKGTITFDGENIDELTKESIRGNLSVISQNAYIFNMSIYDNLKIVKSSATKQEIIEACKLACLDDFINELPNKYDTIVGEGGVTLSGGQKQRLAIARALLLKTEILLFDEATSALDNETQFKIQEAINNLKGEYTILIIAHRLSTIIDCDKIFVIEDGKVIAKGTHKYLLKNSEEYQKLYKKENKEKR